MPRTKLLPMLLCLLLLTVIAAPCFAGPDEEKAREIFQKNKAAVVTVELVLKTSYSMRGAPTQEDETKMSALGTVIGPDGLTVAALSAVDPSSMFEDLMMGMGQDMNYDTQVSEAKLILEDRSEIPARVLLRDRDMDLAFIRPLEKPEKELPYVDFNNHGAPQLLDKVVTINRLGKVANRVHSVSFEWIEAIVEKPRTFYMPGDNITNTGQGSPGFLLDGTVAGIFVTRTIKSSDDVMSWGGQDSMAGIIRPAADVLEAMQQVPEWGEEKEPEEEAPTAVE